MTGLTNELTVAYEDPATAESFVTLSVEGGSSTITSSTTVTFDNPDVGTPTTEVVTTSPPTMAPTDETSNRDNEDDDEISDTALGFAIAGSLIGAALICGAIYYCAVGPRVSKEEEFVLKTGAGSSFDVGADKPTVKSQTASPFQKSHESLGDDEL
jgi:hypothetical protein